MRVVDTVDVVRLQSMKWLRGALQWLQKLTLQGAVNQCMALFNNELVQMSKRRIQMLAQIMQKRLVRKPEKKLFVTSYV